MSSQGDSSIRVQSSVGAASAAVSSWIVRTDPRDVARVESKTCICTPDKFETVCHTPDGIKPIMGNWIEPQQYHKELDARFPGCMAGQFRLIIYQCSEVSNFSTWTHSKTEILAAV